MSTIKHTDKNNIVREVFSFPGDPMTLSQGGGYPLEQSTIDRLISNGVNSSSFTELSYAFRLILQSVEEKSNSIYKGLPSKAIAKLRSLIVEWSDGGAGNGSTIYLGDDCIEHIFTYCRTDMPQRMSSLPDGGDEFELWDINTENNTATLPDGKGGRFLIEFTKDELEGVTEYDSDFFTEHTMGLEDEETWAYFFSDDEIQFMIEDVRKLLIKINDCVQEYDEKLVLKLN